MCLGNERRNAGMAVGIARCVGQDIPVGESSPWLRNAGAARPAEITDFILLFILFSVALSGPPRRQLVYFFALFDLWSSSVSSSEAFPFLPFIIIRPQQTRLRVLLPSTPLLLSPARVTRDSINITCPNNPTFPVQAALPPD